MKDVIIFELEDGTPVYIESKDPGRGGGMERVGRTGEKEVAATKRFAEALAHIRPAAETVLNTFREMNTPSEIGLEFGLKMNASAGAIFTSVGSEATFKVSLKWVNPKTED